MILDIDAPTWEHGIHHYPPDKDYDNVDVSGRIVYPSHNDRRRYLWPMIVDDVNGEKTLFVYGPHFLPTAYFHLTKKDCDRLRWGLMHRKDKVWGLAILSVAVVNIWLDIVLAILHFVRR